MHSGFELSADAFLDTTEASPQTSKAIGFDMPAAALLDTSDAEPQFSKA